MWNEAVTLGRKGTADHIRGVKLTPLKDLLAAIQGAGVPTTDLGSGASINGMPDYIKAVIEREKNIAF